MRLFLRLAPNVLLVVLLVGVMVALLTRPANPKPEVSLAEKIDHACKPGYKMYDWNVYSDRLIMVTCAKFQAGLLRDQYVAPVATT